MFGRLIYVAIILAVVAVGGFVLNYLGNEPGLITIDYADRVWEFSIFQAAVYMVIGILLILAAIWIVKILYALFRFLLLDDKAFDGFLGKRRERKGLEALAKGMVALEEGNGKLARKKAEIAERALGRPELTRLLNAKAADLSGNRERADTYYKALLSAPETAFVGAQGLMQHALEDGRTDRALKLANKAHEIQPKDGGTLETMYMLQSQKFDWTAARKTLTAQRKAGLLPKPEANKREGGLALAQAIDAEKLGETEHARSLSVEAAKLDPSNTEAVSTAVRHLVDAGSKRAASKLVQDSWRIEPHPQLAAAYAKIEPDEAPAARRRRFEGLFALQPDHAETRFLQAELALVAEDWTGARKSIEALRETEPSARSCAIFAAIARGEGEADHIVRGWLARALGAPRDNTAESVIGHAAMLPLLIDPSADAADITEFDSNNAEVEEPEILSPNDADPAPANSVNEPADDQNPDDDEEPRPKAAV